MQNKLLKNFKIKGTYFKFGETTNFPKGSQVMIKNNLINNPFTQNLSPFKKVEVTISIASENKVTTNLYKGGKKVATVAAKEITLQKSLAKVFRDLSTRYMVA